MLPIENIGVSWYVTSDVARAGFYEWRGRFWRHFMTRSAARAARAALLVALVACTSPAPIDTNYTVTWSAPTVTDGTRTYTLDCGDVSGHPCSLITHATAADIVLDGSDGVVTWAGFVGSDANGNSLADDTFVDDVMIGATRSIVLPQRGDDGGLRLDADLAPTIDGWSGDVSWQLGSVAGTTTFHLNMERM